MNKNDFMKALGMIDDDLIHEAKSGENSEAIPENGSTVSGVELYHRPVWQRISAAAATLLLVLGVGSAGTYYLSHRGAPAPDNEQIIAASTAGTAQTETTSAETRPATEQTTVLTRKRDTLAKTTIKDYVAKEDTDTTAAVDSAEETVQTQAQTEAEGNTAQTSVQTTAIPVWTQFPQTTKKPISVEDAVFEEGFDIFDSLAKLSYVPITCDGIPKYILVAPDGTVYQFADDFSWVWRKLPTADPFSEPEEGYLYRNQIYYLLHHGDEIGLHEEIYGY